MVRLPIYQDQNKNLMLLQTNWASALNPILADPELDGLILSGISLINGVNVINHKLGRAPQGWSITDINAAARIFRSQPFNDLTLTLTSDAACTVNIKVF